MLLNWPLRILLFFFASEIISASFPPDDWRNDRPWPGHRCEGQYDKRIASAWTQKGNSFSVLHPSVFDKKWTYNPIPLQFDEENPSRFKGVFYQVSMGLMISLYTTSGNFDVIDARGRLVNEGLTVTSAPIVRPTDMPAGSSAAHDTSAPLARRSPAPPAPPAPPVPPASPGSPARPAPPASPGSPAPAAPPAPPAQLSPPGPPAPSGSNDPIVSTAPQQWPVPPTDTIRMQLLDAMLGVRRQCIRIGHAGAQWARRNTVLIRIERDPRPLLAQTCTALSQIGAQVICSTQTGLQNGVGAAYNMQEATCNLYRDGFTIPLTKFHVALPTLNHCAGLLGLGVTGSLLYLTAETYLRPPGSSREGQIAIENELVELNSKLNLVVQYIGGTLLVPQPGQGLGPNMGRRDTPLHLDWAAPEPDRADDGAPLRGS
ncbi:hypothetical protein MMC26_005588 [Xylographa opegraphella]|nr:hypothetical protein [Xylographa opegraphella]